MVTEAKLRSPLIIDPDMAFLQSIKNAAQSAKVLPQVVANGKDAQLMISDEKNAFSAIFLNPEISYPGGLSVIRCAKLYRPTTPVYILSNAESVFTDEELKKLGIQKSLQKPINYEQIMTMIAPASFIFQQTPTAGQGTPEHALDSAVNAEDSRFISIRATDFLSGSVCVFDVYVRLNSNKYVKILQGGDKFLPERVKSYIQKGVTVFYLKKEAQENYLAYCDQIASALLKRTTVPLELKVSQVLNHGEETLKFLATQGVNEVNIQYASQFLGNLSEMVKGMSPGKVPLLKGFLNDLASYDHGVGVATLAGLLIPALNIASSGPVETVGLGALFHDIGLFKLGITSEDTSKMTPEEFERFKTHPSVGAEILSTMRGFKPTTIQAVLQHHERRNKKGFPFQLGAGSISLVAEVIGICDDFFRIVQRLKAGEKFDLATEMKTNIFDAFSPKVVQEFKKVFLFTEPKN